MRSEEQAALKHPVNIEANYFCDTNTMYTL